MSNDAYISDDDRHDESDADMAECLAWWEEMNGFDQFYAANVEANSRTAEMMRQYVAGQIKAMRQDCPF